MARTYDYYNAPLKVNILSIDPNEDVKIHVGTVFFSIRFQTLLMGQNPTASELGFVTREAIYAQTPEGKPKPTFIILHSQPDACRMGLIRELAFSLIPQDQSRTINPYGSKYNTGVSYVATQRLEEVLDYLRQATFQMGPEGGKVPYVVQPGSIREKKAKKTTPTFY